MRPPSLNTASLFIDCQWFYMLLYTVALHIKHEGSRESVGLDIETKA